MNPFKGIPQQVAVNRTPHSTAEIVESPSGELNVVIKPLEGVRLIRGEYLPVGNRLQFPNKWGKKEAALYLLESKIADTKKGIEEAEIELEKLERCLLLTKEINY
jgi:hypothetical protein